MSKFLIHSLVIHFLVFLVFVFGLPKFWRPAETDVVITIEMLPVTGTTNLKPKKTDTTSKHDQIKKDIPKSAEQKPEKVDDKAKNTKIKTDENKEEQKQKLTEQLNSDEKKESTKRIKEEEKKKKEEKIKENKKEHQEEKNKKQKKKEKNKKTQQKHENDFDSLLKTLEESKTTEKKDKKVEKQKSKELDDLLSDLNDKSDSDHFDNSKPLSLSEEDAIKSQIEQRWNIPAGAKDAQDLKIILKISIKPDGTVYDVKIVNDKLYLSGNSFYIAAADSAIRAAHLASPLKNLPTDKYNTWKEIELNFSPADILN